MHYNSIPSSSPTTKCRVSTCFTSSTPPSTTITRWSGWKRPVCVSTCTLNSLHVCIWLSQILRKKKQHNTFLKKIEAGFDITHSVFGNRLVYRYTQALFLGVFFPPQKNDETRGFTTEILRKLGWLRFTSMQVFQQVNSLHKKRVSALRESLCTDDR